MFDKLSQAVLFPGIFLASILFPKKSDLWLFSAWFGLRYEDSPRAMFEACHLQAGFCIEAYWIYNGERPSHPRIPEQFFVARYSARGLWLQLRARVFVLCVNSRDFWPGCITRRNFVIQTWHGTPMKRIGYPTIRKNRFDALKFWFRRYTTDAYDIVLSPSDYTDRVFGEAFRLPEECLLRSTYPRNAAMYLTHRRRDEIRSRLFRNPAAFIWIYLPTHRNEGSDARNTLEGYRQIRSLGDSLSYHNIEVAFKPHFYEEKLFGDLDECASVYRLKSTCDCSLYEILGAVDGLITDYSSVAYDFAERSSNIVIFDFDLTEFRSAHREMIKLPADDFEYCASSAPELGELLIKMSKNYQTKQIADDARDPTGSLLRQLVRRVSEYY